MPKALLLILALSLTLATAARAQRGEHAEPDSRYFVGTTAFVLLNFVPDPYPPKYAQINLGVYLSPTDALALEAITWQYFGPLGKPLTSGRAPETTNFPGRVQAFGIGLVYKRVLWRGVYAAVHATPLFQRYLDEAGEPIQNGFQLFNTLRVGYHAEFFGGRLFAEPSIAATTWPINTNLPASFQAKEDEWPSYFLGEPGLHVGINL